MTTPPPEFPSSTPPAPPAPGVPNGPPGTPGTPAQGSPLLNSQESMTVPAPGPTLTAEAPGASGWASRNKGFLIVGGAVVVGAIIIGAMVFGGHPDLAKVGQCARGEKDDGSDFRTVKCDDSTATLRIVGKVDVGGDTPFEVACKDFPTAESAYFKSGRASYTLCLEPLAK